MRPYIKINFTAIIAIVMAALGMTPSARALAPDTYTDHSVLSQGHWVKISVSQSGLYAITPSQLRSWGFSDPARVRVYGYGGNRITDVLAADSYVDDLPLVQSECTAQGVVFYAVGPECWELANTDVYFANNNIYSTAGYYFLTDSDVEPRAIASQGIGHATATVDSFLDRVHYELDSYSVGEAGYILVGESFKTQSTRKFTFATPDAVDGTARFACAIVASSSVAINAEYSVDGRKLEAVSSDKISASPASHYNHAAYNQTAHDFSVTSSSTEITVSVPQAANTQGVWLDYLAVNYPRAIRLNADKYLEFWTSAPTALDAAGASDVRVWDVTDPLNITALDYSSNGGKLVWTNDYHGERAYAAWATDAKLPAPEYVGTVANQDIHALPTPDMVIFTLPEFTAHAQRIAQLHSQAQRPLKALVLNVNDVYNEFASGSADVSAMRKCLKMFYDRSQSLATVDEASSEMPDGELRYALLLGRATYDNRHLTSYLSSPSAHGTIPCWMGGDRRRQFSDNDAFGTDDFLAMLADGSGTNLGADILSIGVGRMPWRNTLEARQSVDKLEQYMTKNQSGTWRNSFLFLADDGDNGVHAKQTEAMIAELEATPLGNSFVSKVYVDAYDIIGGSCQGGRQDMYRMLNEGVAWWNYCGHANNHSWTAENMLNYNDINNLYLNRLPVLMAATCDFLRWDSSTLSGGEILWGERYGGVIGMISATRPVYITDNGYFTRAMGRAINHRDSQGMRPRLGDIYRMAKNDIRTDGGDLRANPNKLRYVLMGDPALELAIPHYIVRLETINGQDVNPDDQVTLMALERATIAGGVYTPDGTPLTDFDGSVEVVIYDAMRSITTQGRRNDNIELTFEHHGDKLFAGSAYVKGGRWELNVAMPGEVADNFREATINMYAVSNDKVEAAGINQDFYVYGYDESAEPDNVAPTIELLALNHESFASGDDVNDSPVVIARIRDDVGINLSTAGVGHQMTLTLDDTRTFNDVSLYFTPSVDGTPSGLISYPMPALTLGAHSLSLKIWDTSGNSASQTIALNVRDDLAPTIFDVYADCNPASVSTNFYLTHDRPDGLLSVTITVSNLMGRTLWTSTVSGRSDGSVSAPVNWDLCDASGRRVPRGIYLYRADVSMADGTAYSTKSRKIAVTGH